MGRRVKNHNDSENAVYQIIREWIIFKICAKFCHSGNWSQIPIEKLSKAANGVKTHSAIGRRISRIARGQGRGLDYRIMAELTGSNSIIGFKDELEDQRNRVQKENHLFDNLEYDQTDKLARYFERTDDHARAIHLLKNLEGRTSQADSLSRVRILNRLFGQLRIRGQLLDALNTINESEIQLQKCDTESANKSYQKNVIQLNRGIVMRQLTGNFQEFFANVSNLKFERVSSYGELERHEIHASRHQAYAEIFMGQYKSAAVRLARCKEEYLKLYDGASAAWVEFLKLERLRIMAKPDSKEKLISSFDDLLSLSKDWGWVRLSRKCECAIYDLDKERPVQFEYYKGSMGWIDQKVTAARHALNRLEYKKALAIIEEVKTTSGNSFPYVNHLMRYYTIEGARLMEIKGDSPIERSTKRKYIDELKAMAEKMFNFGCHWLSLRAGLSLVLMDRRFKEFIRSMPYQLDAESSDHVVYERVMKKPEYDKLINRTVV